MKLIRSFFMTYARLSCQVFCSVFFYFLHLFCLWHRCHTRQASTNQGDQLFELKDVQCESRSSFISGQHAACFNNENSNLIITASSVQAAQVAANCDLSKVRLNTADITCPAGFLCISGGSVEQSNSFFFTESNSTDIKL